MSPLGAFLHREAERPYSSLLAVSMEGAGLAASHQPSFLRQPMTQKWPAMALTWWWVHSQQRHPRALEPTSSRGGVCPSPSLTNHTETPLCALGGDTQGRAAELEARGHFTGAFRPPGLVRPGGVEWPPGRGMSCSLQPQGQLRTQPGSGRRGEAGIVGEVDRCHQPGLTQGSRWDSGPASSPDSDLPMSPTEPQECAGACEPPAAFLPEPRASSHPSSWGLLRLCHGLSGSPGDPLERPSLPAGFSEFFWGMQNQ